MGAGAVSDIPPPPPGFTLIDEPTPQSRRTRTAASVAPPPPPGFEVLDDNHPEARDLIGKPTGEVHDGDTFRMDTGANARLYGADAFELNQTGRDRSGAIVPLGQQARGVLVPFAQPDALVTATGASTYGRPVVTLNNGSDAGDALLRSGYGIATPEYLRADPERLGQYMEAERFARLNGKGAWRTAFEQPASYRHKTPDPWAKTQPAQAGDATAVFNDEPMPFQGLRPEIAKGYADIFQDMSSKPEDLIAYANANGFQIDEGETRQRYAARAKTGGAGSTVSYKDAPRVLTDNKDGVTGSFLRGVADPINMLDEAGAVVDSLVPNDRENVWSSDRRFGDILANNLDQNRSILAFDDAEHPYARFGGQLAGGLITPGASIEGLGYRTASQVLRNGGTRFAAEQAARQAVVRRLGAAGAVEGGLAGIGQGEDGRGRFQGAVIGAPAGLALGTAAGTVAPALGRLIGSPFSRLAGRNGEQAAQDLADGAIDSAKSRASNDLPRPRDVLDIQPSDALATLNTPRQPDVLSLPPRFRDVPDALGPVEVNTAAPIRPAPSPRSLTDIAPDAAAWAEQHGWQRQQGDGLPPIMLHGSPRPDIDEFDPYGRGGYGLFGAGTYLTDSAEIAAEYTGKGLSKAAKEAAVDRTMYAVRHAVRNPLDMDKPADRTHWEAMAQRVLGDWTDRYFDDLPAGATNEQFWREVEDHLTGEGVTMSEGQETMDALVRSLGHDGITHIGGGRINKDGPRHRVVIALDPEQTEIVDRLSVGQLMQPPGPRNPDWIDVGQVEARGSNVEAPRALDPSGSRRGEPVDYIDAGRGSQAMANEADVPTLYGPDDVPPPPPGFTMLEGDEAARVIDGLNQNPRPLLDDVTAGERAAQADGIRPADVLPLPANTVEGVDEAASIEAGRYAPVRAPNEDAALSSRTMPSGTTGAPVRKRGPADLVTWLRSEGGIRAQGGELQRYGIDNAPRQGMDFAGGEGRFGALVRNDGMSYDDAAQRAWEAGYFPDHAERPTVAEFLDRLQATHSGSDRAFRPDDLAEVDAFEAARRQRFDVEQARDRGAPLTQDRSQPIGPDDLDANATPVQAYEEWGENAPNLAGNIRLDKLDSPQDIKRALVDADRRLGGFDAATRGRITHAETERLASELGMKADDLLQRRKGQAFNAEEALAARQLLARSGTDLVNMAKRIQRTDNPGEEMEAAFKQAWLRHVAIQEQVSGMTAEAGRALSAFRMAANASAVDRVLPSLGDVAGGASRLKDVADRIVDLEASGVGPGGVNSFTVKALKPRFRDKLVELYYNSLLSGPQTHVTNMLGNTLTAIGQIPEHAAAAAIGGARRVIGQGDADRVLFSELGARTVGMIEGAREGIAAVARTMRTGEAADAVTKVEQQAQNAISGIKGSIIRTPTRALAAEDELFKGIARRMELAGISVREAAKEGLTGAAAKARAAELLANPTDAMLARSFDYGRYLTFQNALGPVGRSVSAITEAMPALKLILPFVRTPTNILKFAIERSPAAPLLKEWRNDIAAGGAKRDLALARVMVGTGVAATIFQMAQEGKITGGGPADKEAKRLLMTTGWQPYSFKVGNQYVSYQRLDPYSTTIGTAADVVDLQRYMTDKQRDNSALLVGTAILHNLGSKTWLSGLSDALEALNDPDRSLESFTSRMAGSIAVPAIVAQAARTADPVLREARAPLDRIRSRVPGLSKKLLPRRDAFGRQIATDGGLGPDIISPIWASTERPDTTVDALLAVGAHVPAPSKKVGGRELSPAEYDRWQQIAGAAVKPQLDALVGVTGWNALPAEERKDMIDDVVSKARRQARKTFLGGATGQGSVPPPPPGFTVVQ